MSRFFFFAGFSQPVEGLDCPAVCCNDTVAAVDLRELLLTRLLRSEHEALFGIVGLSIEIDCRVFATLTDCFRSPPVCASPITIVRSAACSRFSILPSSSSTSCRVVASLPMTALRLRVAGSLSSSTGTSSRMILPDESRRILSISVGTTLASCFQN